MNTAKETQRQPLTNKLLPMTKILRASTPDPFILSCWKSCRIFHSNLPLI